MSAIYYDQESKIKANQCKTIVTFDNTLESKILDAGNILILNALVDAKRANSFNSAIKMLNANVEITHNRLVTLENRILMMAKAIMPAL